jgi:serine-type D-Ala-D-Ala carboxypeptidase (penicillin-binding protein 5/6)
MTSGGPAVAKEQREPQRLPASSWILVDPQAGDVLAAEDPAAAYPVASATKLMTYLVARDELRPADTLTVPPYKATPGESLAGFGAGDEITARDAFYGLLAASGNEAAVALAGAASGTEEKFVAEMNEAARSLGLADTAFEDPVGIGAGNVSSARDLADLTAELRSDRLFRAIVDTQETTLGSPRKPIRVESSNTLLEQVPFVDGVKTGTTLEAGYVLVGSGTKRGVSLVSVVLGAPSEEARDAATLDLLEYGFSLYAERALVRRGERIGALRVAGETERLPVASAESVTEIARRDQEVEIELRTRPGLAAPIEEGDVVGVAQVRLEGEEVSRVDVVATESIAGLGPDAGAPDEAGPPSWVWAALGGAVLISGVLAAMAIGVHRRGER